MDDYRAVDEAIRNILNRLGAIEKIVFSETRPARDAGTRSGERVASDRDLDSQYGNPIIKYGLKAKHWDQQPDKNVGRKLSECSSEYLLATAKYLEACAFMKRKDGEDKAAGYKELDASRARGWAKRNQGRVEPAADTAAPNGATAPADFEQAAYETWGSEEAPF